MVSFAKRRNFLIVVPINLLGFFLGIAWNYIPASGDILTGAYYKFSHLAFGGLYTYFVLGALLVSFLYSVYGNKFEKNRELPFFLFISLISVLAVYLIDVFRNLWILSTGMFLLGVGISGALLNCLAIIEALARHKTSAIILFFAVVGLGSTFSPFYIELSYKIGLLLGSSFLMVGFVFLLASFFCLFSFSVVDEVRHQLEMKGAKKALVIWFSFIKKLWPICLLIFVYSINEISFWDWGGIFLTEIKNLSNVQIDVAASLYWGAATLSNLFFSFLFLRVDFRRYFRFIPVLIFLTYLILLSFDSLLAIMGALALAGFSCAPFFPLTVRIAIDMYPKKETQAFGVLLGIYFIGTGFGSYLLGLFNQIFSIPLNTLYWVLTFLPIILLVIIFSSIPLNGFSKGD